MQGSLALVLTGGGARAAYQVGVLTGLARRFPDLRIPILVGVSAGAVNAAHLASHPVPSRAPSMEYGETMAALKDEGGQGNSFRDLR